MRIVNVPFQSGYIRINHPHQGKSYHPYLQRISQRRYAGHGRTRFHTARAAQGYAQQWAERAGRILSGKENGRVI